MLTQINGLHHVTAIASSAVGNNAFFSGTLGLRRVKTTVNFDRPEVYHLYYGDDRGHPGTVMTHFPFEGRARGSAGTGEVGITAFSVPKGTTAAWADRLAQAGVTGIGSVTTFGETRLHFDGPDGETLALVETDDPRVPWIGGRVPEDIAIRGFHSVRMRLAEDGPTAELLRFMGYEEVARDGALSRYEVTGGNPARVIEIEVQPDAPKSVEGAGSVHHIAFSVANRARQLEVREALTDAGFRVTPVIDRNYFWAIYFRTPGGVLFEVATDEPGFDADEDLSALGSALKLPAQHEHLRAKLERELVPLD